MLLDEALLQFIHAKAAILRDEYFIEYLLYLLDLVYHIISYLYGVIIMDIESYIAEERRIRLALSYILVRSKLFH